MRSSSISDAPGQHRAGDFDYETGGIGYARHRRTDPRIAMHVHAALGAARSVVNVGAGAGSYEPVGREVTPVEPSSAMRAQRPDYLPPAVDAISEELPFPNDCFDAAMATVTVHQWRDLDRGLHEMRRVTRGPVVILTFDGDALASFWLAEYAPELIAAERARYPAIAHLQDVLGGTSTVSEIPIPIDCVDGFGEAFYARPESFLDDRVRRAQSGWGFVDSHAAARSVDFLRAELASGDWDRKYGALREQPEYHGSLRLLVAMPD